MKKILALALCTLCMGLNAQHRLNGKVIDDSTKKEISFATLYFPELETGVTADDFGNFNFELNTGTYKLVISSMGFETKSIEVTIPTSQDLIIELKASAIEMEEVIVSTPFHKLQSENVMKVEQRKTKALEALGSANLAEGITNIAGVESVTTGNGIGKPVIRGLSSNRVLVYTQGVRLENQQYGDEHGLGINSAGIESVEVIKGPASLLYGSDALGGVLYLNPERFANNNTSAADASVNYFSNTRGYNTNAGYKASKNGYKFLFRGSLTEHSDYNTNRYRVTNSRYREQDFKAGFGYQNSTFKTELRYNVNNAKIGLPETIGVQNTNKAPLLPYQNIDNHILSSKSTFFFKDSSLDVVLGFTYNNRKEFEEHHHEHGDEEEDEEEEHEEAQEDDDILEPALHMKLKTFNYNIKYHLPTLGRFETIVGVQGMSQKNTNYGEELLIPNATINDVGLLATSHIHFQTVDVQLGARFDRRQMSIENIGNRDFNAFNSALGFKTNPLKRVTLRLNLASGFRAPNLAELASDGTHEGTNRYEIGNIDLKNEQNYQVDLALEYKNEYIELFANAFYNKVNNYIFLNPNGNFINEDPVFLYEQKDASLYGGEFGFHLHPHPLDWLHFESSFETVTGKLDTNAYLPLIPANSITNTARVELNLKSIKQSYAFVRLRSTFAQNNVNPFETKTDAYNLLSVGLGGTFTVFNNDMKVTLSATNVLDTAYIHHLSRLKPDGILNMGRNINFGVNYTL